MLELTAGELDLDCFRELFGNGYELPEAIDRTPRFRR